MNWKHVVVTVVLSLFCTHKTQKTKRRWNLLSRQPYFKKKNNMDATKSAKNVYSIDQILGTTRPSKNGKCTTIYCFNVIKKKSWKGITYCLPSTEYRVEISYHRITLDGRCTMKSVTEFSDWFNKLNINFTVI